MDVPDYAYRAYDPLPARPVPIEPRFIGMGVIDSHGSGTFPRHRHRDYEVLVPEGPYRCRLNDVELAVTPGQTLVVKPGDWHEDLLAPRTRHIAAWFHLGLAGEAPGAPSLALFNDDVLPEQQVVERDLRAAARTLLGEYDAPDATAPHLQQALLAVLFWQVVRAITPAALAPGFLVHQEAAGFPARLRIALARLASANPSPAELAQALGLGERALRTACKRHLGTSPARACLAFRLERAGELLRTGLAVSQVSARLGFANPYHFARAFRRHHGMPPSRFRAG